MDRLSRGDGMESGAGSRSGSLGLGSGNPSSHAFPSVDFKSFVFPSARPIDDAVDAFPTALPIAAAPALTASAAASTWFAVRPDHKSPASSSVATSSAASSAAFAHTIASSASSADCDQDRKHVGSGVSALDYLY